MITYENWRIGIPELYITDGQIKLQLNKEFEEWSEFLYEDQVIARWKASFVDEQFDIILQIDEKAQFNLLSSLLEFHRLHYLSEHKKESFNERCICVNFNRR